MVLNCTVIVNINTWDSSTQFVQLDEEGSGVAS
jgi:hypothetical protein